MIFVLSPKVKKNINQTKHLLYIKIFYFEVNESDLGDKTKTQTLLMD